MRKKDLTFGIPIYNAEKYIEELLNCFCDSDVLNYEIILIDDGSSDSSLEICNKIKLKKNLDIRIFSQKNHGVSFTRNRIIKESKANWITFIDADDLISFFEYEKFFLKAKESDYDLYINVYDKTNYEKISNCNCKLSYLIERELINSPCTKFYKTELLINNSILFDSDFDLGEDLLFNLICYLKANRTSFFFSEMYDYRKQNENSLTHKYRDNKRLVLSKLNTECFNLLKNENTKVMKALEYIRIKGYFSCVKDYIRFNIEQKLALKEIKEMKKERKNYFLLNNFKYSFIYNAWYILPSKIIMFLLRVIYK